MIFKNQKYEATIPVDGFETDVVVHFNFTPETLGTRYRPNGDPGDPPEPAEVDIFEIIDPDLGDVFDLISNFQTGVIEKLEVEILENFEPEINEPEEP